MKARKPLGAPLHLEPATRRWWESVVTDFALDEHHLRVLTLCGEAWDRCAAAREAIKEHGLTYIDSRGAPKPRPEVSIEIASRAAFARLLKSMDLDIEQPRQPGRQPGVLLRR